METFQFPWNQEPAPAPLSPPDPGPTRESTLVTVKRLAWRWVPATGIVLFLGLLAFQRAGDAGTALPGTAPVKIDVLVPVVPIPKDRALSPQYLRQLPLDKRDLTKTQLMRLVQPADTEHWNGQVKAKKDLPPGQPLFWSDLRFDFPSQTATEAPLRVHVSED
jgi:hypothetical protein